MCAFINVSGSSAFVEMFIGVVHRECEACSNWRGSTNRAMTLHRWSTPSVKGFDAFGSDEREAALNQLLNKNGRV